MIGDGMGLSQISAGMYANDGRLNLERMRHIGLIKTYSQDNLITDSAAGATAFACGKKTINGALAITKDGKPLKTILEIAHNQGLSTGLVATSTIQHATPAAFYAHRIDRGLYEDITEDFLSGSVDLAIGGGNRMFNKREDKRNIQGEMEKMGYKFFPDLISAGLAYHPKLMILPEKGHLPPSQRGRKDFLVQASNFATQHLQKQEKGFFLMIEASQIDWGGHSNDSDYLIQEMIDFDKAIGRVLDFAQNDGNTLVIVTADHETGGFSITGGKYGSNHIETIFSTTEHTGTLIPVFAFGPGAEEFTGIYENTAIFYKMMEAYGFDLEEEN